MGEGGVMVWEGEALNRQESCRNRSFWEAARTEANGPLYDFGKSAWPWSVRLNPKLYRDRIVTDITEKVVPWIACVTCDGQDPLH